MTPFEISYDDTWNCTKCPNILKCKKPCPPIQFFSGGNKKLKEKLIEYKDGHLSLNYNDILAKKSKKYKKSTPIIEKIRAIEDLQVRAIAALAYAHVKTREIARLLKLARSTVYLKIGQANPTASKHCAEK